MNPMKATACDLARQANFDAGVETLTFIAKSRQQYKGGDNRKLTVDGDGSVEVGLLLLHAFESRGDATQALRKAGFVPNGITGGWKLKEV